ncbi:YbgA family protein [Arcobacter sp. FWKO B]|uniref:YbgA family protein n=1 Tax=Arcobacter sp. FWKO B TaxID=2593672 RepID=UPI0018A3E0A1|nr:DUF523 and DUF1722 domain-containing protein [Arcobacter sp. FWKO B]QOG11329.1 DUF1722 domain-containing protein [Arcobacter sp. FWKO B]
MKLAISACLNGENCTFSASNNNDEFIRKYLNKHFEFFHFCPEVNILGAPRETVRLVNFEGNIRVISNKNSIDFTDQLVSESQKIIEQIKHNNDICGVILKSKSPTCGMERVKVYMPSGIPDIKPDMGILTKELKKYFPLLPIEENNRLIDPWLRENFVMQIYAYNDFELFKNNNPSMGKLVEFHTSYKYLIMSKSNEAYKRLGNIVANRDKLPFEKVLESYEVEFKVTIDTKSSIKKTINVLEHCYGYIKNDISDVEKESFFESLDNFRDKLVPLILPLSILQMFINKHNCIYLKNQKFFSPYPKDLALRSNINSLK